MFNSQYDSKLDPKGRLALPATFFNSIVEVELDSAGRLLIPKLYQTYASLEKDVVVVGMGTRIELWNPEQYLKNIIVDTADLSSLMEKYLS
ncbi:MAG: division/cell wall cluster transcriptional repressor MraZ [Algoriphagus sp.]|nr:division/cell wall cluster transcriptional repressor MraZ [Algoriphagus sp.]